MSAKELAEKQNGKVLRVRLEEFKVAMLEKFYAVEHKHRGKSVTDDDINWLHFDWSAIESHFWEEVNEVGATFRHGSSQMQVKELVDVANMAFLLWWRESQLVKSLENSTTEQGGKEE